jgi:hypothetical protein
MTIFNSEQKHVVAMLYAATHCSLMLLLVSRGIKFQDLCVWISLLKNHDTLIMASISTSVSFYLFCVYDYVSGPLRLK